MTHVAIIFTIVVHTLGIPVMIWAVRGEEGMRGLLNWLPRDDDEGGDGGSKVEPQPEQPDTPPAGGLPLPESAPARTRLREHGDRVADPARRQHRRVRPAQPAEPAPSREPAKR